MIPRDVTDSARTSTFVNNEPLPNNNINRTFLPYYKKRKNLRSYDRKHKYSLDDFRIMKLIGKGGFAKVFMVEQIKTKKMYALKAIKKSLLIDNQVKMRCTFQSV